jgi:hypothetical protein
VGFLQGGHNSGRASLILNAPIYTRIATPIQAWTGPEGSRRLRDPEFRDNRYKKVAIHMYMPLLLPGDILGIHFFQSLSLHQGHSAAGRINSIKNANDTSGIEPVTFQLTPQYLNQLHCPINRYILPYSSTVKHSFKGTWP